MVKFLCSGHSGAFSRMEAGCVKGSRVRCECLRQKSTSNIYLAREPNESERSRTYVTSVMGGGACFCRRYHVSTMVIAHRAYASQWCLWTQSDNGAMHNLPSVAYTPRARE